MTAQDQNVVLELKENELAERRLNSRCLDLLALVFKRQIHLKMGYPSLHEFCVKELNYTDGRAFRRIKAMHLLNSLPEIKDKIDQGTLSLSSAASAQNYFQQHKVVNQQEKIKVLGEIEHKSAKDTAKHLAELSGKPSTVKVELDEKTYQLLKELQSFRSHKNEKIAEIIQDMAEKELEREKIKRFGKEEVQTKETGKTEIQKEEIRIETSQKESNSVSSQKSRIFQRKTLITTSPEKLVKRNRYIKLKVRRFIFRRDQCCTFTDPITKRRCKSTWQLEIDHIHPYARGGSNEPQNLRLLCDAHNRGRSR